MTLDPDAAMWLPLNEAAARLGLSRHQLRRRVRAGQIASRQVQGPHGLAYEVSLDPDTTVTSGSRHPNDSHGDATVTVTPPLAELVSLVRDTQAQLLQATAAAAMWQTRAEMLASQLEQAQRALPAPTTAETAPGSPSANGAVAPTQTPAEVSKRTPWWAPWRRATS